MLVRGGLKAAVCLRVLEGGQSPGAVRRVVSAHMKALLLATLYKQTSTCVCMASQCQMTNTAATSLRSCSMEEDRGN